MCETVTMRTLVITHIGYAMKGGRAQVMECITKNDQLLKDTFDADQRIIRYHPYSPNLSMRY